MSEAGTVSVIKATIAWNRLRTMVTSGKTESDCAVELRVVGLVDNTHATFAELLKDFVVGKDFADYCRLSDISYHSL